jgi:putative ABC transport system ATP-binding protein
MMVPLEWRDVEMRYGGGATEVRALTGVSLAVEPGELVAIMGPSGSGKSTLLHLAGGLEQPTAGAVLLDGTTLSGLKPRQLADMRRRKVGYVFQKLNLLSGLTALENVMLPLDLDGRRVGEARRRAVAALERVGLDGPYDRYPDDLSGGEAQRVAIARGLVGEQRVLLADEPTGALDTLNADRIIELLADLAGQGTSVVLVTHEPRFASWADRVVFLRDGVVVNEAVPASVSLEAAS